MNKSFSNLLSGVAILLGLTALALSLTSQGPVGLPGDDGSTPYIGVNGNWWIGETDSGVSATGANASQIPLPHVDLSLSPSESQRYNETLNIPFTTPEEKLTYAQNLVSTQGFVGISTASQLINISDIDGKYVLLNDITFASNVLWSPINFNGTGSEENFFSGIFDGAGFSISNVTYESIDFTQDFSYFGLFEGLNEATIRHLYLTNFNIYSINNDNISSDYVGSLAGIANNSELYNINMDNTLVSGTDYIGGLVGSIYGTSVRFITANLIRVWGGINVGGLFGQMEDSELSKVNIKTILNGATVRQGGVTGTSTDSFFTHLEVEIDLNSSNSPLINYRYDVGGIIGSSERDRLFNVITSGIMEFIPIDTNFTLANVGGVIGYGTNIVLSNVENRSTISIYMDETDYALEIRSIGGVVGAVEYGTMHSIINAGDVKIFAPENGLDPNVYLDSEETPVEYIGGVLGYVYGSVNLKHVINAGNILGIVEVGGIIGSTGILSYFFQQLVVVDQSVNFGSVGGFELVGGLMGISDARTNFILANFMNYGNIDAINRVGGLFGLISPAESIKVHIINSYNRGVITAADYGVGGLIGGIAPNSYFFDYPVFGEVHIYNSFNAGLIRTLNLGKDNYTIQDFAGGSIVGFRSIVTYMYGVSFTPQNITYVEMNYDFNTNSYFETGNFIEIDLPGVGDGNNVDMTLIHNPSFFFQADLFVYQTAWDFYTVWTSDGERLDGLPYLQFLDAWFANVI